MIPVIGLIAALVGAPAPGALIQFNAACSYTISGTPAAVQAQAGCVGVTSPLQGTLSSPVFLSQGYERTIRNGDGEVSIHRENLANGMVVRFFHKTAGGQLATLEGLQLSDGRVLVDGVPLERNSGM